MESFVLHHCHRSTLSMDLTSCVGKKFSTHTQRSNSKQVWRRSNRHKQFIFTAPSFTFEHTWGRCENLSLKMTKNNCKHEAWWGHKIDESLESSSNTDFRSRTNFILNNICVNVPENAMCRWAWQPFNRMRETFDRVFFSKCISSKDFLLIKPYAEIESAFYFQERFGSHFFEQQKQFQAFLFLHCNQTVTFN